MHSVNLQQQHSFSGHDSLHDATFIRHDGDRVLMSSDLSDVLESPPAINEHALSHYLQSSLCPPPMTVYGDVYILNIGDRLDFDPAHPAAPPKFTCEYPYFQNSGTGGSIPSTTTLLDCLTRSFDNRVKGTAALMLSAGKDSSAVLACVQNAGRQGDITAYTVESPDPAQGGAGEAAIAAKLCAKVGVKHHALSMPDAKTTRAALNRFFTHSPHPNCDPTLIPYVACLYAEGIRDTDIIDGTRSDAYTGMLPTRKQAVMASYYRMLGGGFPLQNLRGCYPFTGGADKFFSTYMQYRFYKHAHFRHAETARFYDGSIDTHPFWWAAFQSRSHLCDDDMLTLIAARYFDSGSVVPKARLCAKTLDCRLVLPWADRDLARYYHNLPHTDKFDDRAGQAKLLIRKMLREVLDYDDLKIGKRAFYFNRLQFVAGNLPFIREEILSCRWWNKQAKAAFEIYAQNPKAAGALIDWFLLSGWLNHCKYLKGRKGRGGNGR
ncbi:MAG: asparagine synthase-related protein [Bdellovibrionales bacterium]